MDQVEDIDRDRVGDRLSEGNVNQERVSEVETDREVSAMMQEYDVIQSEGEDERSPPKLELAHEYREYRRKNTLSPTLHTLHTQPFSSSHPPPPLTMDIPSVRFQPVPVKAQAEMTSTYGHPRLNWPVTAKVNKLLELVVLDGHLIHTCTQHHFM